MMMLEVEYCISEHTLRRLYAPQTGNRVLGMLISFVLQEIDGEGGLLMFVWCIDGGFLS